MRSLLFVLAALSTNAIAQLRWEDPEQKVTAAATDQFVVAKYQFTQYGQLSGDDYRGATFLRMHDGSTGEERICPGGIW